MVNKKYNNPYSSVTDRKKYMQWYHIHITIPKVKKHKKDGRHKRGKKTQKK